MGHYFCYIKHDKTGFWGYTNNVCDIKTRSRQKEDLYDTASKTR